MDKLKQKLGKLSGFVAAVGSALLLSIFFKSLLGEDGYGTLVSLLYGPTHVYFLGGLISDKVEKLVDSKVK